MKSLLGFRLPLGSVGVPSVAVNLVGAPLNLQTMEGVGMPVDVHKMSTVPPSVNVLIPSSAVVEGSTA